MSATDRHDPSATIGVNDVEMRLEVVVIPVSDVDRAKEFYASLGWRLDADFADDAGFRIVQFTPHRSACSIQFGAKLTSAPPGSATNMYLVVPDVQAARDAVAALGVDVSEVFHEGSLGDRFDPDAHVPGPADDRATYGSFASFSDPDGNTWLLQEITTRLPGRVDPD
jgi:catechol 2,3-dioxygenase-like lactoylglutathione lyase family enzyme